MTSGACRGGPKPGTRPLFTHRASVDQDHLFLDLRPAPAPPCPTENEVIAPIDHRDSAW